MKSFDDLNNDLRGIMCNPLGILLIGFLCYFAASGLIDTFLNTPTIHVTGKLSITQDGEYLVYPATVTRVVDGDTVDLQFRIWPDTLREERIRMIGIDAPEVRGEEREQGLITTDYLKSRLSDTQVYLKTDGSNGKYGRLLGILLVEDGEKLVNMNQELIAKGLARPYN